MESLAHAIRQLQSGALERAAFFVELERVLANASGSAGSLLEVLSEENARAPLAPEVYAEVQRRITRLMASRQRMSVDDTYVQTKPGAASSFSPPDERMETEPLPERMKAVGDTLNGRFVLEECIGFGGMGTVYKALDLRKLEAADRKPYIAIKVLNVQFRGHPKSLVALQREARKAQALAHPNIVSVYDFDRDGPTVFLTMEYLSGKPLSQMLRAPGFAGMPYAELMPIVTGMGRALAYAHERGFVHCDFKPANVFLTDAGKVKVIDFGIARVFQKAEEEVDVTVFDPGSLGALTPAYASPEMLERREPDPRDDIYALACITYELLTGRHPFNRMSAIQARAAGMKPQRPPKLGRSKWQALKSGLSFDRETRTPTVARFLSQFCEPSERSRSMPLAAPALMLAVLAIAAAVYWWQRPEPGEQSAASPKPEAAAPPPVAASEPPPAAPSVAPSATPPAAPSATPPATPPATPAAAAPVSALAAVTAALATVPCSALVASGRDHEVTVHGFLSKSFAPAQFKDILAAIPGVKSIKLDVQPVDNDKCALVTTLAPYWAAHRRAGAGADAAIRVATRKGVSGGALTEGDKLMVEIRNPGAASFATVDYFMLDGSVVHLLPNLRERDNRTPAGQSATIGNRANWVIGKPFGTEMVVLLSTPVPLFDGVRPESESSADYLRAVGKQLARIGAGNEGDKIGVDLVQITTRPRKR